VCVCVCVGNEAHIRYNPLRNALKHFRSRALDMYLRYIDELNFTQTYLNNYALETVNMELLK